MIKELLVVKSQGFEPRINQAAEAALIDYAARGAFVLYLWTNHHAVFIGKHQNAYLECNTKRLAAEKGVLCRRLTGGGAVYHDKGNLNYTFIAPKEDYNEQRQFEIILDALNSLGFGAQLSGRNDITIAGRKFSGNAFLKNNKIGLHHGTLLIKSNYEMILRYLSASKTKLRGNGVESVASRIINLSEIKPEINKEAILKALVDSCAKRLGIVPQEMPFSQIDAESLNKWHKYFCNKKRLMGSNTYYDAQIEHRFAWGVADIRLKMDKNKIIRARIYSDALDTSLVKTKENALIGEDIYNVKNNDARDIIEILNH